MGALDVQIQDLEADIKAQTDAKAGLNGAELTKAEQAIAAAETEKRLFFRKRPLGKPRLSSTLSTVKTIKKHSRN